MCGLAGAANSYLNIFPDVSEMISKLTHRGPDQNFFWHQENFALALNRLAIVDLEGGRQPFANEDGSLRAIFNGEIYNFEFLKKVVENRGCKLLQPNSDGDVICHLYEHFGFKLFDLLEGMFSIAIVDIKKRQVILGRDAFGIKPLYYSRTKLGIYFASEIKALIGLSLSEKVSVMGVSEYLLNGYTAAPNTIYNDIHQIVAGHYAIYDLELNTFEENRHYFPEKQVVEFLSPAELQYHLRSTLDKSVKLSLMGNTDVACFLSGGIDSSVIAFHLMNHLTSLKSFTLIYPELEGHQGKMTDFLLAREIAQKMGIEHHEIALTHRDLIDSFDDLIYALDEPFSGVFSTYFVAKEAAKYTKVAFTGDGSDELFGSYRNHRIAASFDKFHETGFHSDEFSAEALAHLDSREAERRIQYELLNWSEVRSCLNRDFCQYLQPLLMNTVIPWRTLKFSMMKDLGNSSGGQLQQSLQIDIHELLPDNALRFSDRLSMWHSLETRPPFLTKQMHSLSLGIPHKLKIADSTVKRILVEAYRGILPDTLLRRKKEGFIAPLDIWMDLGFKDWMLSRLDSINNSKLVDIQVLRQMITTYQSGDFRRVQIIWRLFILAFQELDFS